MILELIERIRERLAQGAYFNEAAISHGIVTPILNALGWHSADPQQMVPEFPVPRGWVDLALIGRGRRPAVFIEVKGVGRAMDGDRQLFEYACHRGVPLCVLTDGGEWSFYVPGGKGSY
jgi:predicted type IV restriction endonuclease